MAPFSRLINKGRKAAKVPEDWQHVQVIDREAPSTGWSEFGGVRPLSPYQDLTCVPVSRYSGVPPAPATVYQQVQEHQGSPAASRTSLSLSHTTRQNSIHHMPIVAAVEPVESHDVPVVYDSKSIQTDVVVEQTLVMNTIKGDEESGPSVSVTSEEEVVPTDSVVAALRDALAQQARVIETLTEQNLHLSESADEGMDQIYRTLEASTMRVRALEQEQNRDQLLEKHLAALDEIKDYKAREKLAEAQGIILPRAPEAPGLTVTLPTPRKAPPVIIIGGRSTANLKAYNSKVPEPDHSMLGAGLVQDPGRLVRRGLDIEIGLWNILDRAEFERLFRTQDPAEDDDDIF